MPFKATYNKDFFIKDDCIHLSTEYLAANFKKFKKITGSRFASILGKNAYNSPAKTWMIMTNLYYEEMDETLSKTGNIVEPILRKHVEKTINFKYKEYNTFEVKWDVFKENKIFGGIPDGEPIDEKGNFLYDKNIPMLEIKTTSIDSLVYKKVDGILKMQKDENNVPLVKKENGKLEEWYDKNNNLVIPLEYELQLSLYLYLRNVDNGLFVVGFLDKHDYANPEKFEPSKRRIEFSQLKLNRKEFQNLIDAATNWYNKHIVAGISPKLTEDDKKILKEHLF